jgi:Gram-negative bacterial TonB protein C-terminal
MSTHQPITSKLPVLWLLFLLMLMLASIPAAAQSSGQVSVVQAVAPPYPPEAISTKSVITGDVRVNVQIDPSGAVVSARAIGGHPLLYKAAEAASRRWLFSSVDAQSSMRAVQLSFAFRVEDYKTPDELGTIFKPPFAIEIRGSLPVIIIREGNLAPKQHRRKH